MLVDVCCVLAFSRSSCVNQLAEFSPKHTRAGKHTQCTHNEVFPLSISDREGHYFMPYRISLCTCVYGVCVQVNVDIYVSYIKVIKVL